MKISSLVVALLLALPSGLGPTMWAQSQPASGNGRTVVHKVDPAYPAVAKHIRLAGTVKLLADVAADGTVKKVEPVGGSPLLLQAAESAVARWKYVPGGESQESVEIHFTPE